MVNFPSNETFIQGEIIGYCANDNELYKTVDAGYNWDLIYTGPSGISECHFLNESFGWMITEDGVFKTTNGGEIWLPVFAEASSVYFKDENIGFVTVGNNIFKTSDGGSNWKLSYSHSEIKFLAIAGYGNTVVAAGHQAIDPEGGPAFVIRSMSLGE